MKLKKLRTIKYSICYSTITPESVESGDHADTGFIEKDTEGTLEIFLHEAMQYGCIYTSNSDGSGWLYSEYDYTDRDSMKTGEKTSYSMHINSKISESSLKRINRIASI